MFIFQSLPKVAGCMSTLFLLSCVSSAKIPDSCDLAITKVDVVDMTSAALRRDQTVRIGNGLILSITPSADNTGGRCNKVVNAAGQFMAPGLNDAHIHIETNAFTQAFGLKATPIDYEAALAVYLAHGVTGVRVLSGGPDILAYRDIAKDRASPLLNIASPMLSGKPPVMPEPLTHIVTDAPKARVAVAEYLDEGYDFIKIRSNLTEEVYDAVLDEAHARGAYVDGHLTRTVGANGVLASSQDAFAHLDEFAVGIGGPDELLRMTDAIASCDCFITSALSVTKNIVEQLTDYDAMVTRDEMAYLHPVIVGAFWLKPNNPYFSQGAPIAFFQGLHQQSTTLFKSLIEENVQIVAGTDAMNPMIIPGSSLHDELEIMTNARLTPFQALSTATKNISEQIPGFEGVGVLEPGRKANAVLVSTNPLDGLAVMRRPDAVIVNGHFLDRDTLDASLALTAAIHQSQ